MRKLILSFAIAACVMFAADLNGTWKGTADTPNGPAERTFVFKVDGQKLTGETTSSLFGKSAIEDGKVNGDEISFVVPVQYEGQDFKFNYKGKLAGEDLRLTVTIPQMDQTIEWKATKVKQ